MCCSCCSILKEKLKPLQAYAKTAGTGVLLISFLWGLYRLLNDISVFKELENKGTGRNIYCSVKTESKYDEYCVRAVNNTAIDCSGEDGYDKIGIFHFTSFQTYFIWVVVFAGLSAGCSIVHDWYLRYWSVLNPNCIGIWKCW